MERRYLSLDIETITDWELVRQVMGLDPDAPQTEIQEQVLTKYPSGFLPPPFHIPVCIAMVDVDYKTGRVENAAVLENSNEKSLLQSFWKLLTYRKGKKVFTTLISFNGRGFDFPVLFLRSLKYRVPVVTWDRARYSFESSHDLCDDLSDFGATSRTSLDVLAKLLGLPGKTDVRGDQVEELYRNGEIEKIKDYCMDDALTTYLIWLTVRMIRGELSEAMYGEAFHSAREIVQQCRSLTDDYFSGS